MSLFPSGFKQVLVNNFKHLPSAVLSGIFYGFPEKKLKFIGVTGTDGKTTTVSLIYHILHQNCLPAAMISTVSVRINDNELETGLHVTAPDPWQLRKFLRKMIEEKIKYVVLEVTSHGLDQFRVWGISYEIGVITNVTHEHLDYHRTYENYLRTKAKLFKKSKVAIVNKDDSSYDFLASKLRKSKKTKVVTYAVKAEADFTTKNFPFKTKLPGEYNQYNCLAAIAATSTLGISGEKIREAVSLFEGVTGRMEEIDAGQDFRVIVDFAHTPNALQQALKTLKVQSRRIIVVFGCAGLRDKTKRPMMGRIAGKLADFSIITAEDPRTEKVEDICGQIAEGCEEVAGKYKIVPDRQEAVNFAVNLAKKNDVVIVCGKGHEKSMCFGRTEYPWSDQEAARKAIMKVSKVSKVSNVGAQHVAPAKKES